MTAQLYSVNSLLENLKGFTRKNSHQSQGCFYQIALRKIYGFSHSTFSFQLTHSYTIWKSMAMKLKKMLKNDFWDLSGIFRKSSRISPRLMKSLKPSAGLSKARTPKGNFKAFKALSVLWFWLLNQSTPTTRKKSL